MARPENPLSIDDLRGAVRAPLTLETQIDDQS
jgi:hypothetical protein